MFDGKRLSDVAVPAHRFVRAQNVRNILDRNVLPLKKLSLGGSQHGFMVSQMKFGKFNATKNALLSAVPLHQYSMDQTIIWRDMQTHETFLATVFFDWPTRTVL